MCPWQISSGSVNVILSVILPYLVIEKTNYTFPGVCFLTADMIHSEGVIHSAPLSLVFLPYVPTSHLLRVLRFPYVCMIAALVVVFPEVHRNLVGNLRCFIGMQQRWSFWKCNKPEKKLKIIWFIWPGCQPTPSILLRCCSSPRPLHRALLCSVACTLNPPHIITEHLRGRRL